MLVAGSDINRALNNPTLDLIFSKPDYINPGGSQHIATASPLNSERFRWSNRLELSGTSCPYLIRFMWYYPERKTKIFTSPARSIIGLRKTEHKSKRARPSQCHIFNVRRHQRDSSQSIVLCRVTVLALWSHDLAQMTTVWPLEIVDRSRFLGACLPWVRFRDWGGGGGGGGAGAGLGSGLREGGGGGYVTRILEWFIIILSICQGGCFRLVRALSVDTSREDNAKFVSEGFRLRMANCFLSHLSRHKTHKVTRKEPREKRKNKQQPRTWFSDSHRAFRLASFLNVYGRHLNLQSTVVFKFHYSLLHHISWQCIFVLFTSILGQGLWTKRQHQVSSTFAKWVSRQRLENQSDLVLTGCTSVWCNCHNVSWSARQ